MMQCSRSSQHSQKVPTVVTIWAVASWSIEVRSAYCLRKVLICVSSTASFKSTAEAHSLSLGREIISPSGNLSNAEGLNFAKMLQVLM